MKENSHQRGFIPFLLLLVVAWLLLKYVFDFDVIQSVKEDGLKDTVIRFFSILGDIWSEHVKPFLLEAFRQIGGAVSPGPNQ